MASIDYADIVEAELTAHDIMICTDCEGFNASHSRGFATPDTRVVHFNKKMATRATLHDFLHEVGHILKGHGKACRLRRFEKEGQAEEYARESMRAYGIPISRKRAAEGAAYIKRMRRWGRNIAAGRGS